MRNLVTRILWLAAAGTLLYGGFVAYERWWDDDWSLLKNRVLSFVNERTADIQGKAAEKGNEVIETVKQEATERAKSTISSLIGGAIESIGETIKAYGESVAGTSPAAPAPAASAPAFSVPPPPVALSVKVGEILTFAVSEGSRYAATWGDGASDEGEKDADATVFLTHAWAAPGDYVITLVTGAAGVSHTETFPVRIYE